MYEITMPKLSDSMQEGKIIAWKVKPGARVREGDVLAEVESDKATMELECFHSGVLAKVVHGDGSEVPVGEVIGYIDAEAKGAELEPAPKQRAAAEPPAQKPAPKAKAAAAPKVAAPRPAPAAASAETRVAASPRARKLAQEKGIDLGRVKGSGPGGRIIAQDVEALSPGRISAGTKPSAAAGAPQRPPAEPPAEETRPAIKPSPDEELPAIDVTDEEAEVVEAPYRLKSRRAA